VTIRDNGKLITDGKRDCSSALAASKALIMIIIARYHATRSDRRAISVSRYDISRAN